MSHPPLPNIELRAIHDFLPFEQAKELRSTNRDFHQLFIARIARTVEKADRTWNAPVVVQFKQTMHVLLIHETWRRVCAAGLMKDGKRPSAEDYMKIYGETFSWREKIAASRKASMEAEAREEEINQLCEDYLAMKTYLDNTGIEARGMNLGQ